MNGNNSRGPSNKDSKAFMEGILALLKGWIGAMVMPMLLFQVNGKKLGVVGAGLTPHFQVNGKGLRTL